MVEISDLSENTFQIITTIYLPGCIGW